MANVSIQDAINRIAIKVKQIAQELDNKDTTQDGKVTALQNSLTAIQTDITNLENSRALKQITGNVDFTTQQSLKGVINDDEFVSITTATGLQVTGRIVDTGTAVSNDPIIIKGWRTANDIDYFGTININSDLSVTGGYQIQNITVPVKKDISVGNIQGNTDYRNRNWTDADVRKEVEIHLENGAILNGSLQKSDDTNLKIGMSYTESGNLGNNDTIEFYGFSTKPNIIGQINDVVTKLDFTINEKNITSQDRHYVTITKFYIWE